MEIYYEYWPSEANGSQGDPVSRGKKCVIERIRVESHRQATGVLEQLKERHGNDLRMVQLRIIIWES